jgi:hypothetical protein
MGKKAVSLTLDSTNLLWAQGWARQAGARSLSEAVDRLITEARIAKTGPIAPPRSVVGTVTLDDAFFDAEDDAAVGERGLSGAWLARVRGPGGRRPRVRAGRG